MPTAIEAKYGVVTPMFCAGADPSRAELRLPSFKGVLRYWWRALAWSRLAGDLGAIQRREDELFGSAGGGQSRVLMRLAPVSNPPAVSVGTVLTVSQGGSRVAEGARYLGYGVMEAFASRKKNTEAGQLTRACLRAPFDFTVLLRCPDLDDDAVASLKDALKAVGLLGGMGTKSRKGYGSLVLRSLQIDGEELWHAPQSTGDLRTAVAALARSDGPTGLPEFTALSREARHVLVTGDKKEPVELLDLVGRELVRYRSWGKNEQVLGSKRAEQNFPRDHNLVAESRDGRHPERLAFGLPHNYFFSTTRQSVKVGPYDKHLDRRASPLFIHIHQCGATPVAILSFLPARFLPQNRSDISVGGTKVPQVSESTLYQPVHDFLDRLLHPDQRREPFANAVEVRP